MFLQILPQEAWLETQTFVGCQIPSDGRQVCAVPTDRGVTHCQVWQAVRQQDMRQGGDLARVRICLIVLNIMSFLRLRALAD